MTNDLGHRASRGVLWNLSNQWFQQIVQFFVTMILARLLQPEDFGVFGMAFVFVILLQSLRQWGFQAYLVQKKDIDEADKDTAFWAISGMGVLLFIVCFFSAPLVGNFFHNAGVVDVFRVLAVVSLLSPFGAVQWALVTRELNFKVLALRNLVAELCYGVTVVFFAYQGYGVWALVIASLVREVAWSALFWVLYAWRPRFKCNLARFKEMAGFSLHCIGAGTLNYTANNIDSVIVGRVLGPANLGQFNLATRLVAQPQDRLVSHIAAVAFPVFSQLKNDLDLMRGYYLKTLRALLVIVTPIFAILCASARDVVVVLFGSKWEAAVVPMQIMCIYGCVKTITSIAETTFLSHGRADLSFKVSVLRVALVIPFILWGVRYGIVGVSWAILGYFVIVSAFLFWKAHHLLQLSNRVFCGTLFNYTLAFLLVYGAIFLMRGSLSLAPIFGLVLSVLVGGLVYLAYVALVNKGDLSSLWMLLKKALKK